MPNPIGYSEFFDFSDRDIVSQAIADMKELQKTYQSFLKKVTGTQIAEFAAQMEKLAQQINGVAAASQQLNVTNQAGQKSLAENLQLVQQLREENKRLKAAKEGAAKAETAVADSVNGLNQKLKQQVAEYNALSKAGDAVKMGNLAKDIAKTRTEINALNAATKSTVTQFQHAKGSYAELDAQTKKLVADLKQLQGGMNGNSREAKAMQKEIFANTQKLKDFDAKLNQNFRNVGNYKSALGGLNNVLGAMGLATVTLAAVMAGLNNIVNTSAQFQALEASIRAVTSSEAEFGDTMQFLEVLADKYGQSIDVLGSSYKGLAAAAKGTSLEGAQTKRIFESVVQAGTALKLSSDKIDGALLAVQQMMSKGTVSAEELRGQLGERLPGAFGLFAKAAGVSEKELGKMMQKGEIIATDVLPKFAKILSETYSDKAIENAHALGNETNRLSNAWEYFTKAFDNTTSLGRAYGAFKGFLGDSLNAITVFLNDPSIKALKGIFNGENAQIAQNQQKADQRLQEFAIAAPDQRKALLAEQDSRRRSSADVAQSVGSFTISARKKAAKDYEEANALYLKMIQKEAELQDQERINAERAKLEGNKNDDDANKKHLKELEKARKAQDQLLQDSARYQIALKELEFSKSAKTASDEEHLENERLRILEESYSGRLKLYKKDSREYYDILTEKANAETAYNDKIIQIRDKGIQEREKQELKHLENLSAFRADNYDAEVIYEKARLAIVTKTFEDRLKLYRTDSDEYKALMLDKAAAEEASAERIRQIDADRQAGRDTLRTAKTNADTSHFNNVQKLKVARGEITPEEAESEGRKSQLRTLDLDIDRYQSQLDMKAEGDKDYDTLHAKLIDAQAERERLATEDQIIREEEAAKKRQDLLQAVFDFATQTAGAAFEINRDINAQKQEDLEHQKDEEIKLAGNNAAAKQKIEENYQKKILVLKRKQAIADKLQALFDIGISTAVGVMKTTAELGLPAAAPFIALTIATGAVQAAAVLAKPLPKYYKGRKGGRAELAEVNEQGFELIEDKAGNMRVERAGKPGVAFLNEGDTVHTHTQTKQIFRDIIEREDTRAFSRSLEQGTGVMRQHEAGKEALLLAALKAGAISERALSGAFGAAIGKLPIQHTTFDENGVQTFFTTQQRRGERLKKRNSMFGNG